MSDWNADTFSPLKEAPPRLPTIHTVHLMEKRDHVLSEADATRIIDHMNAKGITLEVAIADGQKELRIDFDEPLHTPEDARHGPQCAGIR